MDNKWIQRKIPATNKNSTKKSVKNVKDKQQMDPMENTPTKKFYQDDGEEREGINNKWIPRKIPPPKNSTKMTVKNMKR